MTSKMDEYAQPKNEQMVAEEEVLKYLLAFEPLLDAKKINYEWSFTDYHLVTAPAQGFRSIIEFVLNKATSNFCIPDFILVFSHSFDNEMVIEFELGHRLEEVEEYYFNQSDIDILNQIYSHYGWQLTCETNEIGSLLTWTIQSFSAAERPLSRTIKQLKSKHLGDLSTHNSASDNTNLARAGIIDVGANPSPRLSLVVGQHYQVSDIEHSAFLNDETMLSDFQIVILRGNIDDVCDLMASVKQSGMDKPIFAICSNIDIEAKIKLLELGCTDVIDEAFSANELISKLGINSNFALVKNAKTGAKKTQQTPKIKSTASADNQLLEIIRLVVEQNYHDAHFNERVLSGRVKVPLAKLDFVLSSRIYHTCEEYIESCRLAEGFELLMQGASAKDTARACGFNKLEAFDLAYQRKYGVSCFEQVADNT